MDTWRQEHIDRVRSLLAQQAWDCESLHQFRTNLRAFLSLLPLWCRRKRQSRLATQLKQQLKRTGAQRDRDVFRPMLKGLPHAREARALLDSTSQACTPVSGEKWLHCLSHQIDTEPPASRVHALLLHRLAQVQTQRLRCSRTELQSLHRLRLALKQLRYLLDWLSYQDAGWALWSSACRRWLVSLGYYSDRLALVAWLAEQSQPQLAALMLLRVDTEARVLCAALPELDQLLQGLAQKAGQLTQAAPIKRQH